MSGPLFPHVVLPEIPIPPWSVVALLAVVAVTYFVSMKGRPWDFMAMLFGAAAVLAPLAFWFYFKPTYFEVPEPPTIKPFGTLVALGVYLGSVIAVRHGRQRGLDVDKMNSFIFWVVGLGFVGGHVLDAIFYTPEKIQADPLYIVKIWAGLSSFGGFTGAIIGAVAYKLVKKDQVLAYVDTVCSAFPLAWVFGRSGCATVHDHPGKVSDAWYAVKCVEHADKLGHGEGAAFLCRNTENLGRYDLGLIECVLTIPLAVAFALLWWKRPRQYGFFAGWMCILYAPVRFVLDFFRAGESDHVGLEVDPRHAGLTPAQWACFGLIALGFYIVYLGKKHYPPVPATYAEAQAAALAHDVGDADTDDDEDAPLPQRSAEKVTKKSSVATPSVKSGKKKKGAKKSSEAKSSAEPKSNREAKPDDDDVSTGGSNDAIGDDAPSETRSDDASVGAPVKVATGPAKGSASDEAAKKDDDAS